MSFFNNLKEVKSKILKKVNFYFLLISIFIFALDRFTKLKIIQDINENPYYVNDYINLDLTWNIGIGFGLLSTDSSVIYYFISLLISVIILILFIFFIISKNFDKFIYSIIIGGALGNLYDRLFFNAVPDFIDLHYRGFHWFTFNIADIFISIGILIFLIRSYFVKN